MLGLISRKAKWFLSSKTLKQLSSFLTIFEKFVNKNDSQLHKKKTYTNNHSQQCFFKECKTNEKEARQLQALSNCKALCF